MTRSLSRIDVPRVTLLALALACAGCGPKALKYKPGDGFGTCETYAQSLKIASWTSTSMTIVLGVVAILFLLISIVRNDVPTGPETETWWESLKRYPSKIAMVLCVLSGAGATYAKDNQVLASRARSTMIIALTSKDSLASKGSETSQTGDSKAFDTCSLALSVYEEGTSQALQALSSSFQSQLNTEREEQKKKLGQAKQQAFRQVRELVSAGGSDVAVDKTALIKFLDAANKDVSQEGVAK